MPAPLQCITKDVTIGTGTSLSGAIDVEGYTMFGFYMPSGWDTANLTFAASTTLTGTFVPVYDADGGEATVQAAASRMVCATGADAEALMPLRFIKVRSGTSGSAVNQTANRTITVILKA